MIIPGFLIALLTFPGVIVHEAAHLLFCRLFGLAVLDVCYFRWPKEGLMSSGPAGYVIHETTDRFTAAFFVATGPFFVNTVLCVVFCSAGLFPVVRLEEVNDPLAIFFSWLGLSIGMHAFPSTGDATTLLRLAPAAARRLNPLAILAYPLAGLLYVLNLGRVVWADLVYGIAVGFLAPLALIEAFA